MKTGVDRILQQMGGSPEKNKTGVDKILEILENGGGGGGLPEYTYADKGKVLTIGDDAEHSVSETIIEEQTFTTDGTSSAKATLNANFTYEQASAYADNETPVTVVLNNNTISTNIDWGVYGEQNRPMILLGESGKVVWRGPDIAPQARELSKNTTYTISVVRSIPAIAPVWESLVADYVAAPSSATLTNTIQSLVSDIMTNIITGSKTNIVSKSANLTHADLDSDYAILRETVGKYRSGIHTLFPIATDTYCTVVNGYYDSTGASANLQIVVPNYVMQIPGVGQQSAFLVISLVSDGLAYQADVSAQIKEIIT